MNSTLNAAEIVANIHFIYIKLKKISGFVFLLTSTLTQNL